MHAHADCTEAYELDSRGPGACACTRVSHARALALPLLQMRVKVLLAQLLSLLELGEGEPHGVVITLDVAVVLLEVPEHEVLEVILHLRLVQAVAPVDLVELGGVAGPATPVIRERVQGKSVRAGRRWARGRGAGAGDAFTYNHRSFRS